MSLYDFFASLDASAIQSFVESGREEDLHLEFKTVADAGLSSRGDRKNLAITLSGFANSAGGIVVWGVSAKRDASGVDRATAADGVAPLALLLSRLRELAPIAASPPIEGIQHRSVTTGDDVGFALTYIPESETSPHMAKLGEDRYYKRNGQRFYVLEHFDLEDMFGRRPRPKLSLAPVPFFSGGTSGGGGVTEYDVRVILALRNEGKAAVRAPYLAFSLTPPYVIGSHGLDGNGKEGLPRLAHSGVDYRYQYGTRADVVVAPQTTLEVTAVACYVTKEGGQLTPRPDLTIDYLVAAENVTANRSSITIPRSDILATLNNPRPR